jgi:gas vesicle protein
MAEEMRNISPNTSNDTEDQSTNTLAWFLTGAVIGAVVTALYAPRSGKETREFLSGKAQGSCDVMADAGKGLIDAGRDMFERGRQLVEDAAELFERGRKLVRG